FDLHVRLCQADLPRADGFDLTPLQGDPGLEALQQEVFVTGFSIGGDHLDIAHKLIVAHFMTQRVINLLIMSDFAHYPEENVRLAGEAARPAPHHRSYCPNISSSTGLMYSQLGMSTLAPSLVMVPVTISRLMV